MQIKALHQYDCLRANKSTSAWGLEARVPFLDKEFINVAMAIDPEWKMVRNWDSIKLGLPFLFFLFFYTWVLPYFNPSQIKKGEGRIEKWVLRKAFDDEERPYLPKVLHNDLPP